MVSDPGGDGVDVLEGALIATFKRGADLGVEPVNGEGESGAGHVGLPLSVAGPTARADGTRDRYHLPLPVPPQSVGGFTAEAL